MFLPILLFVVLSQTSAETTMSLTSEVSEFNKNYTEYRNDIGAVRLSRKKRFLVFPEGSSLQLVYCLTMPSIAMADFFVFGWTAAIAWELPNKPYIGVHKKKDNKEGEMTEGDKGEDHPHSRLDSPSGSKTKLYYTQKKSPYSTINKLGIKIPPSTYSTVLQLLNKNFQNPFSDKRRTSQSQMKYSNGGSYYKDLGDRVTMYHDPVYREVHRRTRRDLYPKIEKFLSMQQKDGKACLLKAICEVTKLPKGKEKGSFMQELIRVLFRVKEFQHPSDEKDKYDAAANEEHNCGDMYPTCDSSVFSLF